MAAALAGPCPYRAASHTAGKRSTAKQSHLFPGPDQRPSSHSQSRTLAQKSSARPDGPGTRKPRGMSRSRSTLSPVARGAQRMGSISQAGAGVNRR